jgi:hypothetical protein
MVGERSYPEGVEALAEKLQQHWQGGGHAYTRPWNNGTEKDCVHGLPGQAEFFRQLALIAIPAPAQPAVNPITLTDILTNFEIGESTLRHILWAWREPDYPSVQEVLAAQQFAADKIDEIASAVLALTPTGERAKPPMAADIEQILSDGYANGKTQAEIAEEILREFAYPGEAGK